MGGHVYWLEADDFNVIENLFIAYTNNEGKLASSEIREILSPLQYQTALREQHGIMKRMEAVGISRGEISKILGYDEFLVNEVLDLDWNENYKYSQLKGLRMFSDIDKAK